jgi:type III secretion inner rod protein HrpB2
MSVSIDAVQVRRVLDQLGSESGLHPSQTSSEVAAKFQSLMEDPFMAAPVGSENDGMSVMSKLIRTEDSQLQATVADMNDFTKRVPTLSFAEESAGAMQLMMELSNAQLNLQAKMGVVNSSKSAVETLMKNQ